MSEVFEVLFGSRARARLIRFFLLNDEKEFTVDEVVGKTLLRKSEIDREISNFKKIKLLVERVRKGKKRYAANPQFPFHNELKGLFSKPGLDSQSRVFQKLRSVGDVRLVLISGLFLDYAKSKADLILVANNVNRSKLKSAVSHLEAEVGKEIRFVLMNTEELQYRLNMIDRFLMEFLEGPHKEVLNRVPELKRFVAGFRK